MNLAMTVGERVAVIGATGTVVAAFIAAWASLRTRRENSQQHNVVHHTLSDVADSVRELNRTVHHTGGKLDGMAGRLDGIDKRLEALDDKTDVLGERLHRHIGEQP